MKPFVRVVPWTTNQEFQHVFEWLYADVEKQPDLVQLGVDRVKAWICRGRVPISVRATMDLIELQLREQKQKQNANSLSQNELRLLYGIVLTRFVNIMEDSLQTKYFAKSLYVIAEEIGLPLHFVQLRHAATHEDLPSLLVLRQASMQALQWLYDNYWSVQISTEALAAVNEQTLRMMSDSITMYKEKRKEYLKKNSTDNDVFYMKYTKKLISLLSRDTLQDSVILLLLKVGGLVPTAKRKRSSTETLVLPEDLILLWRPLLLELDTTFPNFASELVSAIIKRIDTSANFTINQSLIDSLPSIESDQEQEKFKQKSYLLTLTYWLRYFVVQCIDEDSELFEPNLLDDILEGCLRNPNLYTRSVLQSICVADPELGRSIEPFILYIDRSLSTASTSSSTTPSTSSTRITSQSLPDINMEEEMNAVTQELETLKNRLGINQYTEQMTDISTSTSTETLPSTGWTLHDERTWHPCPIGYLPNGKLPRLDLVVNDDPMLVDDL